MPAIKRWSYGLRRENVGIAVDVVPATDDRGCDLPPRKFVSCKLHDSQTISTGPWKVFRQLFLRLSNYPVPDEYRLEGSCTQWEREDLPKLGIGQEIIQAMHAAGGYGTHLY